MLNEKIIIDAIEISNKTSSALWEMTNYFEKPMKLSPKIIFPQIRNTNKFRVCEQEARFIYSDILNQYDYFFSVETPTKELYGFSSEDKRAASTDLTLYTFNEEKFEKIMNVEFKAQNPSYKHIEKDIQKLVSENIQGFWFHLLENIDSGTIASLTKKFICAFNEEKTLNYLQANKIEKFSVIFYFCTINKRFSSYRHCYFNLKENNFNIQGFKVYMQNFFNMNEFLNQYIEPAQNSWKIWRPI